MELKEFLNNNPILVKSELAKQMYPKLSTNVARNKLQNKLNVIESGTGIQRILDSDLESAKNVLRELRDNINEFIAE